MPLVIPPGFAQAAFTFTGNPGTAPYVTTLGVDVSDYGGDFQAAADYLMSSFALYLGNRINNDLTLDRVTLYIGDDGPSGSVDSTLDPIPMTATVDMGPTSMSLIVRKSTAEYGRRGRGRMFLPGSAPEAQVGENGAVSPTYITTMNQALNSWEAALIAGDGAAFPTLPVLFHSAPPTDPTPITAFSVAPLVGWIRGRIR